MRPPGRPKVIASLSADGLTVARVCVSIFSIIANGNPVEATQPPSHAECTNINGDFWPTWSPDGTQLAFGRRYGDAERVAIMNIGTGDIEVWKTGTAPAGHPRWSPSGRAILFQEDTDQASQLVRLTLASRKIDVLDPGRPGALADWR